MYYRRKTIDKSSHHKGSFGYKELQHKISLIKGLVPDSVEVTPVEGGFDLRWKVYDETVREHTLRLLLIRKQTQLDLNHLAVEYPDVVRRCAETVLSEKTFSLGALFGAPGGSSADSADILHARMREAIGDVEMLIKLCYTDTQAEREDELLNLAFKIRDKLHGVDAETAEVLDREAEATP